jgi:hypothetical protein
MIRQDFQNVYLFLAKMSEKKQSKISLEDEAEEMRMSQEDIAKGKKLADEVRKILESNTDKETLDLKDYDIVSQFGTGREHKQVCTLFPL